MAFYEDNELDDVVSNIENKLETLEEKREQLHHQIEVKRAQIRELTNTLSMVRSLEDQLAEE
jgi:chaperonin cofactor prefoldin